MLLSPSQQEINEVLPRKTTPTIEATTLDEILRATERQLATSSSSSSSSSSPFSATCPDSRVDSLLQTVEKLLTQDCRSSTPPSCSSVSAPPSSSKTEEIPNTPNMNQARIAPPASLSSSLAKVITGSPQQESSLEECELEGDLELDDEENMGIPSKSYVPTSQQSEEIDPEFVIVVKTFYKEDVRRIVFDGRLGFARLLELSRKIYPFEPIIKFRDDECELVTISNDDELKEALRLLKEEMETQSEFGCIPTLRVYIFKGDKKKKKPQQPLTTQKKFVSSGKNLRGITSGSSSSRKVNDSQQQMGQRSKSPAFSMPLADGAVSGLSGSRNFELAAALSSPGSSPTSSLTVPSSRSGSRIGSARKGSKTDKKEKDKKKDKKEKEKDRKRDKKDEKKEKDKDKKKDKKKKDKKEEKKKFSSSFEPFSIPLPENQTIPAPSTPPPSTAPSSRSLHPPSSYSRSSSPLNPGTTSEVQVTVSPAPTTYVPGIRSLAPPKPPRLRSQSDATPPTVVVEEAPPIRPRSPSVPSAGTNSRPASVTERLLQKRLQRQNGSVSDREGGVMTSTPPSSITRSSSPNSSLSYLAASVASKARRRGLTDLGSFGASKGGQIACSVQSTDETHGNVVYTCPDSQFYQTWKITNTSVEVWPKSLRLVYLGGRNSVTRRRGTSSLQEEDTSENQDMMLLELDEQDTVDEEDIIIPGNSLSSKTRRGEREGEGTATKRKRQIQLIRRFRCKLQAPASVPVSPNKPLMPGEEVDVRVPLTAPGEQGTFKGYWRLQTLEGKRFGSLLSLKVEVTDPSAASSASSSSSASLTSTSSQFLAVPKMKKLLEDKDDSTPPLARMFPKENQQLSQLVNQR